SPTTVTAAPGPTVQMAGDLSLLPGTTYRARLALGFIQCLASRDQIAQVFEQLGFINVRAFTDVAELPADWPHAHRAAHGSWARWAEGTWTGPPRVMTRPIELDAAWANPRAPQASVGALRTEKKPCRCSS